MKAIIFDWGRTLYDPEKDALFEGVPELLEQLSKKYTLVVVSLAVSENSEIRRKKIEESVIARYLKLVLVDTDNKEKMYAEVLSRLNVTPSDIAVVDDRVVRGIAWGNNVRAVTVWVQIGKFANELPDEKTGAPKYIIRDIRELSKIFLNKNVD